MLPHLRSPMAQEASGKPWWRSTGGPRSTPVGAGHRRRSAPNPAGNTCKWSKGAEAAAWCAPACGWSMATRGKSHHSWDEVPPTWNAPTSPSRQLGSRLVRKTPGYSKIVEMHRAAAAWEDIVYNLVRPLKTLRREVFEDPTRRWPCGIVRVPQGWLPQTPVMVAGLTDHVWTVRELLTTLLIPLISNT